MESDIIYFMTCNTIISASHSFLNAVARISPKENSGASGGFLPKPLLLRLRHPNSKKSSRVFCEILSPKNSFRKTESVLVPPPARILGGQNTKEKCPFLFRTWSRANPKSKKHFSLVSAEALRGGGGADSFVQFPLEKGSRKVYNYSTKCNLFGNDCSARRVRRAPQGKIRFCFRREIP